MTTATLAYSKTHRKTRSMISSFEFPSINWRALCVIGLLMVPVLLVLYVLQVRTLITGSYLINNYRTQLSALSEENKNLQVSFAENSFLGSALEKIEDLNFQKVTAVRYIQMPESYLAKAK